MSAERLIAREGMVLLHGAALAGDELLTTLEQQGVGLRLIEEPADLAGSGGALVLLDAALLQRASPAEWREQINSHLPDCLLLGESPGADEGLDLALPAGLSTGDRANIVKLALKRWALQRENAQLQSKLGKTEQDLRLLTEIGIALSAEKDLDRLLDKILAEAQSLACCDAASLYLVDKPEDGPPSLIFKLTRNDSLQADFQEQRMELDRRSIAGYVAVTDRELNIPNAYEIDAERPYSFNPDIDRNMGYRTVSLLALPIRNYREEVIGVLQFINRKTRREVLLQTPGIAMAESLPFAEEQTSILRALASQSAVAIENSVLLDDINRLFSGFVQAAVAAIEQRDPTTSGHSFRVADLTTELAVKLPQSGMPAFRDVRFGVAEIKELRYAALLHDFGKVGVREHVLIKANKLPEGRFELIRYRIRLSQEQIRRQLSEQVLLAWKSGGEAAQIRLMEEAAREELARLEKFLHAIEQANRPTVLEDGEFEHLLEVRDYPFPGEDESIDTLLSDDEFHRLCIRRGSLSPEERAEIESHVVHTANFLRIIPWTPELARIPELAEAHHEKLDGSGYPYGRHGRDIPVGSKIMTICDIYDALTASDRPYKAAMPRDTAFEVLEQESMEGKLDAALVKVFIDAEIHRVLEGKDYGAAAAGTGSAHHPCEPGFHDHSADYA